MIPGYPENDTHKFNLIPVYDVEWLDTDTIPTTNTSKTVTSENKAKR